jgi:hypothetical protein
MGPLVDERGMVASWLFRVVIVFALFGIIVFDAGAMAVNYFSLDSSANEIVYALRSDDTVASNPTRLQEQARALASEEGARLVRAGVDTQGVLHVRIRRAAKTLVAQRIDALDKFTTPSASARASTN